MLLLILIPILASIIFAGCNARNYYLKEKLRLSERPAPIFPQTPIPRSYIKSYYRDWFLALVILVVVSFVVILLCSCNTSKVITGEIKAISNDTVSLAKHKFKLLNSAPMPILNQYCTFSPTRDKDKVNSIKIK